MWDIRRKFDAGLLPGARTVIKFEFSGTTSGKRLWWLVVEAGEVELCLLDPGFELDLVVRTHLRTMTEIWMGDRACRDAIRSHDVTLEGDRALVRVFPDLFTIDAHVALTALARRAG
jgi:hypothetical protein